MADGSLIFDTKVDDKGFHEGLEKLKNTGTKALQAIGKAVVATGAAIGGLGVAATKVGMDFEKSMARVGALSGATELEFKALEKTALELGKSTVFSSSQAAEAMQYLAMAGFSVNETIAAMPGLLNIAAAGQTELGVAADITSNILSGFGLAAEEAARVADVLTKAFTSSNTSLESLGETMKYAAPVAAAAGFSLEEVAAAAGLLGDAGIQGGMAGTVLRGVMLRLVNPPKQAAEALSALGVSITDSSGKIKPLAQIVKELEEATEGMTEAQKTAVISQIAGQNAASGLLAIMEAGGDTLAAFTKELENAGGTAERIANQQIDNLAGDIEILKSALEFTGITIYKSFDTPLRNVTQTLTSYIEEINKTLTKHEDIIASAERLGMTAEELGFDLAQIPTGLEGAIGILGELLADIVVQVTNFAPKLLQAAVNMIQAFLDGIRQNLHLITEAALNLAQAFITALLQILPELVILGAELIVSLITGVAAMLPKLITQWINTVITIADTIINNLPLIIDAGIQLIMALAEGIINNLSTIIQAGIQTVLSIIDGISQSLPQLLKAAIEIITELAKGLIENLDLLLNSAIQIVEALTSFVIENVNLLVDAALEIITALIDFLIENLPMLIDSAVELVMAIVEGLINNVGLLVDAALHLVTGIVQGLLNNLPLLVEAGINLVYAIIDGLLQMIPQLIATGIQLVFELIGAILSMIPQIISTGVQLVGELVIGILRAAPRLLTAGVTLVQTVIEGIKSVFSGIVEVGKDLVRGLWDGIISLKNWILGKVRGFAESIIDGIKKIFGIRSPSAIMRDEIGENLTLGISVGFEKGIPELQRDVEKELGRLVERMKATVELEASAIGAKISAGSSVVKTTQNIINNDNGITQNININQPVESPSEVARHIKRVGRELALGY